MAKVILQGGPAADREMDLPDDLTIFRCPIYEDAPTLDYRIANYEKKGNVRLYPDQTWRWIYEFSTMEDR